MQDSLANQQNKEIKIEIDYSIATYCLPSVLIMMGVKYPYHVYDLISKNKSESSISILEFINDFVNLGKNIFC